jgi:ribulose-phosphate 3-epimerase
MIDEPIRYIDDFAKLSPYIITVHIEACKDINGTIDKIHSLGIKAGISINPETYIAKRLILSQR